MLIAYWIVAGLTSALYLFSGGIKIVRSREQLQQMMTWVATARMPIVRAIGIVEVLGAIGLILPPLTGIAPALAFVAALGLVVVQIGAIVFHLARGEARLLGFNALAFALPVATLILSTIWL
ncbi:DoxX family protein [Naasia lichenicola]|uniref:DoxX family protein n=1 Tax=Naasia lichenicola TaxID=2565933 RepID=A0A4S4FIH0_9MICO|nr:DoxX family protein [Naasia lichenicola]THG29868.1 DoxX family protein [Naasia lichenicola]